MCSFRVLFIWSQWSHQSPSIVTGEFWMLLRPSESYRQTGLDHGITEGFGLEGTLNVIQLQHPCCGQ